MSEIKYEIIKPIGVLSSPLRFGHYRSLMHWNAGCQSSLGDVPQIQPRKERPTKNVGTSGAGDGLGKKSTWSAEGKAGQGMTLSIAGRVVRVERVAEHNGDLKEKL